MLIEKPYSIQSYGGSGYGRVGPPPRKQKAGTSCIQSMISVFIIAVFIVIVMPMFIIPQLGVSMESYENNKMLWSFVAGLIATPFAWVGAKALTYLIRS